MADIVCDCVDIEYTDILEAVKKYGDDLDTIMDETEAGTICEDCLEEDCDKVDIPLKIAFAKALEEVNK